MKSLLSGWGYAVHLAADLEEAREVVEAACRPRAILADYRLSQAETGVETVEALRPLLSQNQLMYAVVVVGTIVITLLIYHYPVSRIRIAGIRFDGKLPVGKPNPRPAALSLGNASAD